ncbi:MAG: PDZ domain-containing protein [Acidimicrobiia bacterium]|nr:PDZ domain-containing protein [Acidimicrobiia bacterium]
MTSKSRWLLFLVSTPLVVLAAVGGLLGAKAGADSPIETPQKAITHLRVFEDVVSLIMSSYVETVDPDRVMEGAMRGLADGLDPMSAYLAADEVAIAKNGAALSAGDVGLVVSRQFYLRIVGVRDGSPAHRAGLRTNDFIRGIDNKPTREVSAFTGMRLLRGAPGTTVELTVLRGNAAEPHVVTLTREVPKVQAVTSTRRADGTAVVRVTSFAAGTAAALGTTMATLQKDRVSGVVLDLRSTADGPVSEGIAAARHFVKDGVLATRSERDKAQDKTNAAAGDGGVTVPIVLLVSNGTAGAAEVFAAALSGNTRGDLVGEPTAGLAAEQRLVELPEGRGLWMTYARYLGSDGEPIHGRGLRPAVPVESPNVGFDDAPPTTDEMLVKAVERLKARAQ